MPKTYQVETFDGKTIDVEANRMSVDAGTLIISRNSDVVFAAGPNSWYHARQVEQQQLDGQTDQQPKTVYDPNKFGSDSRTPIPVRGEPVSKTILDDREPQ